MYVYFSFPRKQKCIFFLSMSVSLFKLILHVFYSFKYLSNNNIKQMTLNPNFDSDVDRDHLKYIFWVWKNVISYLK